MKNNALKNWRSQGHLIIINKAVLTMTKEIIHFTQEEVKRLSNQELLAEINKLSSALVWQVKKLMSERTDLYDEIISRTSFLNENIELSARIYCLEHNITSTPLCEVCNKNPTSWHRKTRSFARYCCAKCREGNPETQKRREETCHHRYGGKCSLCDEKVREKGYITNERRYGDKYPGRTERCKKKARQTNMERRGVPYPMQSKEVREKSRESNLKNNGVDNPMKSRKIQHRAQNTCEERYGYRFATQVPMFKDKIRKTMVEHHGVEHALQSPEIMKKLRRKYKSSKYPGKRFDSKWEIKVYDFLMDHQIEFVYQP